MCVYIYICVCVCVCVCIYIYTHIYIIRPIKVELQVVYDGILLTQCE